MTVADRAQVVRIGRGAVLHPLLPGNDFAHAARIVLPGAPASAAQAYLDIARQVPGWFDGLMRLRNRGMRLLGMKDLGAIRAVPPQPPETLAVGQRLGIFGVQSLAPDAIVLEDDDRHLHVWLSVELRPLAQGCELQLATIVHLHRGIGRAYMLPVAPLHRVIVPWLLERYRRSLAVPAT